MVPRSPADIPAAPADHDRDAAALDVHPEVEPGGHLHDFERLGRAPYQLILAGCDSGMAAPVGADELLGLVSSLLPLGTAGIIASGIMSATFVNVGASVTTDRADGTLTRLAGTPMFVAQGDADQVAELVGHLLDNALDAIGRAGRVSVRVLAQRPDDAEPADIDHATVSNGGALSVGGVQHVVHLVTESTAPDEWYVTTPDGGGRCWRCHWVDIADSAKVMKTFEEHRPARVIHLAAQAGVRDSLENPKSYVHSNIVGSVAGTAAGVRQAADLARVELLAEQKRLVEAAAILAAFPDSSSANSFALSNCPAIAYDVAPKSRLWL